MFSRSQTTLNGGIEIGQALQRRVHHQAGRNERDKTTDGGHAFGRLHHGYGDDNGHSQRRRQLRDRRAQCRRYGTAHEDATQVVSNAFETIHFLLLTTVDLDDFLVGDGFLHGRGHDDHVVVLGVHEAAQTLA